MRKKPQAAVGIDASNLRAGGGITHLSELLQAVEPSRHDIDRIVVWGGRKILERLPQRPWLDLIYDPMLDNRLPSRLIWQQVKLSRLAKEQCDILFVPGGSYGGSFRPFVTMSRNMLPFENAEMRRYGPSSALLKLIFRRIIQTRTYRHADGMIFLNNYAQSKIRNSIKLTGVYSTVIPHGVNQRFFLAPRKQKPLSAYSLNDPVKILYVSIINVYKHQWHVAQAVKLLRKEGLPVELELVGPAYQPALRRLRKTLQEVDPEGAFIHYRGSVPYAELSTCYHEADVFVFASSCENMPNILLEAMASGLPIACSQRGPMPEILGSGGVYFDPEQPDEMAKSLKNLLTNQNERHVYAWDAYENAKNYSWERCSEQTFDFLYEVYRRGIN